MKHILFFLLIFTTINCYSQSTINVEFMNNTRYIVDVSKQTHSVLGGLKITDAINSNQSGMGSLTITSNRQGIMPTDLYITYYIVFKNGDKIPCYDNEQVFISKTFTKDARQIFTIPQPKILVPMKKNSYVQIKNNSDNTIRFGIKGTDGIGVERKKYNVLVLSQYENMVVSDGIKETAILFPQPKDNYVYEFEYTPQGVSLVDARPLRRIGETSWVKTLPEATFLPYPVTSNDGNIPLLAPAKNGAVFYSFTSSGEQISHTVQDKDIPAAITSVMRMENGSLLVAGYDTDSRGLDSPVVQKQNEGGVIQWRLPPSKDYPYANLLAAAVKATDKNVWLVGGQQDTAYIRQVRDEGAAVSSSWELGRTTLDPKCGAVSFILYDTQNDLWRVTGVLAEPLTGSYIIEVNSSGKVLKTNTSFNNFFFYKILGDEDGAYYLVGEELKENDASYAVVIKYDAAGKEIWREQNQAQANSYYQDAVLDETNGQIVLAGTLNATSGSGEGGTPFIQALTIDSGAKIWRQELKENEFKGTALVSGISKAPDYGFVLALCSISGDSPAGPFIIARVNERGLLIKGE